MARSQTSGIPQGTILGPLLFIMYVNDLPSVTKLSSFLFADDFKILSSNNDHTQIQTELKKIEEWSKTWLLDFNYEKCHVLNFDFNNVHVLPRLSINNHFIDSVQQQNDLGVIIDIKLNFDEHIIKKVNKANQILGVIRRSFNNLDNKSFINLYIGLVRSHLEYCAEIWSPHLYKHIDLIENVQRRATKFLPTIKHLPYPERLRTLNLPTLTYRRQRGDMIQVYKLLNNYYNFDFNNLLNLKSASSVRILPRNNQFALFQEQSNKNIRKNFFTNRVTTLWNSLPNEVVLAPSLNIFKNRLDAHWNSIGFKFNYR